MAGNYILGGIREELKEKERAKKAIIKKDIEDRLAELEKLLNVEFVKEEPNSNYVIFKGFYSGKSITVSWLKNEKIKKILIYDILNLNVLYSGNFIEKPEHYVSIIRAYNKRESRQQTGYYRKS